MNHEIYPLEFLYDGHCRICLHDVAHLTRADRHGRLVFVNVMAPDFDPTPYGRSRAELLARIHARRADGHVVEGTEVFRLALAAVGKGWLVAPSRWPGLKQATDAAYRCFARHRVALSRRYGGLFARLTPACEGDVCRRPGGEAR